MAAEGASAGFAKKAGGVVLGALALGVGVWFFFFSSNAEGAIDVTGAAGSYRIDGARCQKRDPWFEVRIGGPSGDPSGGRLFMSRGSAADTPIVRITADGACDVPEECDTITVTADDCETFDARLEPGSYEVNERPVADGHLALECTLGDGTRVRGRVAFEGCE